MRTKRKSQIIVTYVIDMNGCINVSDVYNIRHISWNNKLY